MGPSWNTGVTAAAPVSYAAPTYAAAPVTTATAAPVSYAAPTYTAAPVTTAAAPVSYVTGAPVSYAAPVNYGFNTFGATPVAAANVGGVVVAGADRNLDGIPDVLEG